MSKRKLEKQANIGKTGKLENPENTYYAPKVPTNLESREDIMWVKKLKEVLDEVGTIQESKDSLGKPFEESRRTVRKVFKDIMAKCEEHIVYESEGEKKIIKEIDYRKIYGKFEVEEAVGMQILLTAHMGFLAFIYSNLIAQAGMDYRSTKVAAEAVYPDVKDYITWHLKDKSNNEYIKSVTSRAMISTYVRQVKNANLVEYLEPIIEAITITRNVLESIVRLKRDDRINDMTMSKYVP